MYGLVTRASNLWGKNSGERLTEGSVDSIMTQRSKESFVGKVVLITGGTRGIGFATAKEFADRGATVAITSRKEEAAHAAAKQLSEITGSNVVGFGAHVADAEAADKTCAAIVAEFGGIDVLVNNAGTNPAFGPLARQSTEAMAKTFEVNTVAPIVWTSAALEHGLGKSQAVGEGTAAVVNVASIGALAVESGLGVYNASKAALLHVTRQYAYELAPRVRVNSVSPGIVRTKLSEALWKENEQGVGAATPLGRIGEPQDVAYAIVFLASKQSEWLTGENLVLDGGQLIGNPFSPQMPSVSGS